MRVLVIGGAGFLGANLTRRALAAADAHVTVMDSLDPHLRATTATLSAVWDRIRFVHGDLRDESQLADLVKAQDLIFNCAAQTSHPLSLQYPVLDAEVNCVGNLKLLEAVRLLAPNATVVYPSSSTVVGRATDGPVTEDHAERPLDIYSADKGVAEKYYRIYHVVHGLHTVVLRFANLYGPYGKGHADFGFVNYFIHLARTGQEIKIFGSGEQTRNVLYVEDATDILWRAAHEPRLYGEVYFATGPEYLSVREIAETIVAVFRRGKTVHVEWPAERRRIDVESVRYSSAKLESVTGWRPRYDFEMGLDRTKNTIEQDEP